MLRFGEVVLDAHDRGAQHDGADARDGDRRTAQRQSDERQRNDVKTAGDPLGRGVHVEREHAGHDRRRHHRRDHVVALEPAHEGQQARVPRLDRVQGDCLCWAWGRQSTFAGAPQGQAHRRAAYRCGRHLEQLTPPVKDPLRLKARKDLGRLQLTQRVAGDPARGASPRVSPSRPAGALVGGGADAPRAGHRRRVARGVALADVAQGPVDRLLDEVALVERFAFDERQEPQRLVGGRLVVHGKTGHEGKAAAFDELLRPSRPLRRLRPGQGGLVEQVGGHLVADVPGVEVGRPALHLLAVDPGRLVDEGGQQARLVVARPPQLEGELVVSAEPPGHAPQLGDRHPPGVVDLDGVARHAGAVGLAALRGDLGQDRRHVGALTHRARLGVPHERGHRRARRARPKGRRHDDRLPAAP